MGGRRFSRWKIECENRKTLILFFFMHRKIFAYYQVKNRTIKNFQKSKNDKKKNPKKMVYTTKKGRKLNLKISNFWEKVKNPMVRFFFW